MSRWWERKKKTSKNGRSLLPFLIHYRKSKNSSPHAVWAHWNRNIYSQTLSRHVSRVEGTVYRKSFNFNLFLAFRNKFDSILYLKFRIYLNLIKSNKNKSNIEFSQLFQCWINICSTLVHANYIPLGINSFREEITVVGIFVSLHRFRLPTLYRKTEERTKSWNYYKKKNNKWMKESQSKTCLSEAETDN